MKQIAIQAIKEEKLGISPHRGSKTLERKKASDSVLKRFDSVRFGEFCSRTEIERVCVRAYTYRKGPGNEIITKVPLASYVSLLPKMWKIVLQFAIRNSNPNPSTKEVA